MATVLRVTIGHRDFVATVERGEITIAGLEGAWKVATRPDGTLAVSHDGTTRVGTAFKTPAGAWVGLGGIAVEAHVESAGARPRARTSDADALRPPMSATVVRVHVTAGAQVQEGDALVVLEAMKMELPIRAPRSGVVTAVHCREGELVQPSTVLIDLE